MPNSTRKKRNKTVNETDGILDFYHLICKLFLGKITSKQLSAIIYLFGVLLYGLL